MSKFLSIVDPALGLLRGHHLAAFEVFAAKFPQSFEAFGSLCGNGFAVHPEDPEDRQACIPKFSQPFYETTVSSTSPQIAS